MKVSGGATWALWCIMLLLLMALMPSLAVEEVESELDSKVAYSTITYDLNTGKNGYTKFLRDFRDAVTVTKVCEIQTLSSPENYIYVQLKSSPKKTMTVALDTRDLYVLGYTDDVKDNRGAIRARFFKEIKQDTRDKLFTGMVDRQITKLSENYLSLVKETRFDRNNLDLRVSTIQAVFKEVHGKTVAVIEKKDSKKGQPEANFFFVMCQMIAEATRFKFMETAIISPAGTKPQSSELAEFQNNWNRAAKAIHGTVPGCASINGGIKIGKNTYTTVASLREKIAVIKPLKK